MVGFLGGAVRGLDGSQKMAVPTAKPGRQFMYDDPAHHTDHALWLGEILDLDIESLRKS